MTKILRRLGLLVLAILILGGTVEVAIHHYDPTRVIYRRLKAPDPYLYEEIDPALRTVDAAAMIRADAAERPDAVRARLWTMVHGTAEPQTFAGPDRLTPENRDGLGPLPTGTRVTRLHYDLGLGLTSNPYFIRAANGNGRLVIYHHGFGDPIETVSNFLGALLDAGFDIIAIDALGHGGTLAFVDSDQDGILPHARDNRKSNIFHEMSHFDRPLRHHLRPIMGSIAYAQSQREYRSIDIAGFSMGGFMAMLGAALEPAIERSYPIAGVYPNFMRRGQEVMPDGPPTYPPLMEIANHLELFVLGATGERRRQLQVFNRYDRCCFNGIRSELYRKAVRDAVARSPLPGTFDVFIDESHADHRISKFVTREIVRDLLRDR